MVPYIAIPIIGQTLDEAIHDVGEAEKRNPDILELRIDYIKDLNEKVLGILLECCNLPIIVTNRHKDEAGLDPAAGFDGPEDERIGYLRQAVDLGVEHVDIEAYHFPEGFDKKRTNLIVSYHDFVKTPANLINLYNTIRTNVEADILKFATRAVAEDDVRRMIELIECADRDIIGICMGELGAETRLYPGNYVTYACLNEEQASAPGQYTVEQIRERLLPDLP